MSWFWIYLKKFQKQKIISLLFLSYDIERLAEKYKKEILINGKMLHSAEEKNNKRKFNEEYSNRLQEIITKGISYGIFEDFYETKLKTRIFKNLNPQNSEDFFVENFSVF